MDFRQLTRAIALQAAASAYSEVSPFLVVTMAFVAEEVAKMANVLVRWWEGLPPDVRARLEAASG